MRCPVPFYPLLYKTQTWFLITCKQNAGSLGRVGEYTWWRHQMETLFSLLAICAGNSPVTGEFPAHRPVTRSFDLSFDLRLNKRLNKQSWGWWFETPWRSLWRHRNVMAKSTAVDIYCFLKSTRLATLGVKPLMDIMCRISKGRKTLSEARQFYGSRTCLAWIGNLFV